MLSGRPRSLPAAFRSLGPLRVLNVAAVGLALASVTASVFTALFGAEKWGGEVAVFSGLPTLAFGLLWAALLRSRRTVGRTSLRVGWAASVPLAASSAAVAGGLTLANEGGPSMFVFGAILGVVWGAVLWIPAVVVALLLFGGPLARAQSLASRGLGGEERGERLIGVVTAALALVGLALALRAGPQVDASRLGSLGRALLWALGSGGVLCGAAAAALAHARTVRRRRFVDAVEAGAVAGFRVDPTPEGKVLVRVTSMGQAYRVTDFEEPLVELDDDGEAKRALAPEG